MTISSIVTSKQYVSNGTAVQYGFGNKIFAATDLVVTLIDLVGNLYPFVNFVNTTTGISYSVQGVDVDTGCTVVFSGAPTNGWTIDIRTDTPELQSTSIKNQGQFLPELHEEAFDKLTREMQDDFRQTYTFGIHGPDIEAVPWPALPGASQRANMGLVFDSNGLPSLGVIPTTALTQTLFNGFLGTSPAQTITAAETAASVTPVNLFRAPGDIRRYGGLVGATDNTAALAQAVAQAAQTSQVDAAEVYIPGGNWNFVSVSNAAVCTLLSNVTIRGAGKNQTTLTITGANTTNGFFVGTNVSNVKVSDLALVGNGSASTFVNGGAFYIAISSAAVTNCTGFTIERCAFSNFQANYWLAFFPSGPAVQSFGLGNIRVRDCDFVSLTGNMQNAASIAFPAHCIAIEGGFAPNATMYDVEVTGCNAQCQFIKGFFINWGGTSHVRVHHNVVKSSGLNASDDAGSYAIYAYQQNHVAITGISNAASAVVTAPGHNFSNGDSVTISQVYDSGFGSSGNAGTLMAAVNDQTFGPISGVVAGVSFVIPVNTSALASYSSGGSCSNLSEPDLLDYSHNIIDYVRDNGFYLASCNRVSCVGNTITLQQSSNETSLVKGAVGADGCRELMVANNTIAQCQGGIHVTLRMIIGRAMIVGNSIKNMASNALLIKAFVSPNSVQFTMGDTLLIEGNQLESLNGGEQGIQLLASNLFGIRSVDIIGNHIDCFSNGLLLNANSTADMLIKSLNVKSNTFIAENAAVCQLATTLTPYIDLNGNTFKTGTSFNGSVDHVTSNTSNGVSVRNNIFEDWPSGASSWLRVISPGAGSQCQGNRFINVPTANMVSTADTNDLGRTTPTWTGKQSDWVDNILSIEAGASSSKYVQFAWWYDATAAAWKQLRGLTGN